MAKVGSRLRELRKVASPRLTVRAMAAAMGMPLGSYARYESASGYKKDFLPLDFTRKAAAVLSRHGIDPAEVMKLAGLHADEAAPEARAIEEAIPEPAFVLLPVALPSEAILQTMFESLLLLVPEGASRSEAAAILARRLPAGLQEARPDPLDQGPAPVAVRPTGRGRAGRAGVRE